MHLPLLSPDSVGPSLILLCLSLSCHHLLMDFCKVIPFFLAWPMRHCSMWSCLPSQLHDLILPLPFSPASASCPLELGPATSSWQNSTLLSPRFQHVSSILPLYSHSHAPLFLISMAASSAKWGTLSNM